MASPNLTRLHTELAVESYKNHCAEMRSLISDIRELRNEIDRLDDMGQPIAEAVKRMEKLTTELTALAKMRRGLLQNRRDWERRFAALDPMFQRPVWFRGNE